MSLSEIIKASLPEMTLIGISTRTNNQNEMNPETAKIGTTVQRYFSQALCSKIDNRVSPHKTYSVYTDYASDHSGDYTYFIGEAVDSTDNIPEGFTKITIPAQDYTKFTHGPGPMPQVCIELWQKIWAQESLHAQRAYLADFEIYDERAMDPQNTSLDIYIGITAS